MIFVAQHTRLFRTFIGGIRPIIKRPQIHVGFLLLMTLSSSLAHAISVDRSEIIFLSSSMVWSDSGQAMSWEVTRNGDLLNDSWLKLDFFRDGSKSELPSLRSQFGFNLIRRVTLRIGQETIWEFSGNWMRILSELGLAPPVQVNNIDERGNSLETIEVLIPLPFSIFMQPGERLPLVALSNQVVVIEVELAQLPFVPNSVDYQLYRKQLLIEYVFLEGVERRRIAQIGQELVIEQVQSLFVDVTANPVSIDLSAFTGPVEALYVIVRDQSDASQWLGSIENYALGGNGLELQERTPGHFPRSAVTMTIGGRVPAQPVYIFHHKTLFPDPLQPAVQSNFSSLYNVDLTLWFDEREGDYPPKRVEVYALNENLLRIMSGMAGTARDKTM